MPDAFRETVTISSRLARPSSMASSASNMVMTLVTEATGRISSALCSKIIWPLSISMSMAAAQSSATGVSSTMGAPVSAASA